MMKAHTKSQYVSPRPVSPNLISVGRYLEGIGLMAKEALCACIEDSSSVQTFRNYNHRPSSSTFTTGVPSGAELMGGTNAS